MSTLKAYPGSCHCGDVQYQLKLKFPPNMKDSHSNDTIRIYKCNCTVCQKMGYFHCRPITPAEDFILTSDPAELGEYRASTKKCAWYFCKSCGCRVVGVVGEWEEVELDVAGWTGTKQEQEKKDVQKVWKTKGRMVTTTVDGKDVSKPNHYVSVNAVTLEPSEDIDLRKWHQEGWVFYVENRVKKNGSQMRLSEPFDGSMY